uniref:SLAM family member 7-like n=1 Tax=Scatophagus argus TaxID=75038 RepID=UPI001ED7E40A|nr:SLAM family member 7-like [Scatophagus argus]
METSATFLLLLVKLCFAVAEDPPSYDAVGGKLNLRPEFTAPIISILWKHNTDLLAEWNTADGFTYYGTFKGRTTLDNSTAHLEISKLNQTDSGSYSVEINSVLQTKIYTVKVINEVPKPSVWIAPASCGPALTNCTFTCGGETKGAEPVAYSWKMGDGAWEPSVKERDISRLEIKLDKTVTCRMKNPISEKESEPKENPFYKEDYGLGVGEIIGIVIFVIFIIVVLCGLAYWKKDPIMARFGVVKGDSQGGNAGNTERSPPKSEEGKLLEPKATSNETSK